jgi:hypothetical protein
MSLPRSRLLLRAWVFAGALAATFLGAAASSHACRCKPSSLPDRFKQADAVVLGRAKTVRVEHGATYVIKVVVEVERTWKAPGLTGEVRVFTDGTCAFQFATGESYLLFLQRTPAGAFGTTTCAGNRVASSAGAELKWLENPAVLTSGEGGATPTNVAAPVPSCPEDIASAYHEKWLVIAASSADEAQAKDVASKSGLCVIRKDSFLGLKPDTFVVVAAAKETRKQARAALARVRRLHKDAYVKFAAEWCGKGDPVSAETRAFMTKAGASFSRRSFIPELQTHATYWQFLAEVESGVPVEVGAEFTQGHVIRREFFYFEKGVLVGASADEFWDNDDGDDGHMRPKDYYFRGANDCFSQVSLDAPDVSQTLHHRTGDLACPRACAPGLRAKIASRAQQILAAAKAEGGALEEIVAGIDEGWVESLTLTSSD